MKLSIVLLFIALLAQGCSSSGPKTQFYSLFSDAQSDVNKAIDISVGIGPVVLPEFLDNSAIVTVSKSNQVVPSGYHAWAGDLDAAINRVLVDSISTSLDSGEVLAFPWDTRVRPRYQVRVIIENLAGIKGGQVKLKAKWLVIDQNGASLAATQKFSAQTTAADSSFNAYVAAINLLVNQMAHKLTDQLITIAE